MKLAAKDFIFRGPTVDRFTGVCKFRKRYKSRRNDEGELCEDGEVRTCALPCLKKEKMRIENRPFCLKHGNYVQRVLEKGE